MTTDGSLDVQQAKCPPQAKIPSHLVKPDRAPPWAAVNSPPPTVRTGQQVRNGLLVGERCWITQYGIYHDAEFGLWCEGTVIARRENDRDDLCVHIERTAHGVRVLEWPADSPYGHPNFIKRQQVNYYGWGDCWVVEFPVRPAENESVEEGGEAK